MKNKRNNKILALTAFIIGCVPVTWLALLLAPVVSSKINYTLTDAIENPFTIILCLADFVTIPLCLLLLASFVGLAYLDRAKKMHGKEHGDAEFADPRAITKKMSLKTANNVILTKHVQIYPDDHIAHINIAWLFFGSMGSGKSRFFVIPNIMQMLGSYIILDPAGELLETTGNLLKENGYVIKVFSVLNPENSDFYNPFEYIRSDEDINTLAASMFKNTTPAESEKTDPFFDGLALALLKSLLFVVYYEAPDEEKNFGTLMFLLHEIQVKESDEDYRSPIHLYMIDLEKKNPLHPALAGWKESMEGAGKTVKSIVQSLSAHLTAFNSQAVLNLTSLDTMELSLTGERKTAIFLQIPERVKTYNFLISMLYTSLFDELYRMANTEHAATGKRLPYFTLFLMDEVGNVACPEGFVEIWNTARKHNIGIMMFLQSKNQLKTTFKDDADTILDGADVQSFMGTNGRDTLQYFSDMMGEETVETESYGETKGINGSSSKNISTIAHKIKAVYQLRQMEREKMIALIKGEQPIEDIKYDPTKHKLADHTPLKGDASKRYVPDYNQFGRSTISIEDVNTADKIIKSKNSITMDDDDIDNKDFRTYDSSASYIYHYHERNRRRVLAQTKKQA